jgi:hypothetical protein
MTRLHTAGYRTNNDIQVRLSHDTMFDPYRDEENTQKPLLKSVNNVTFYRTPVKNQINESIKSRTKSLGSFTHLSPFKDIMTTKLKPTALI